MNLANIILSIIAIGAGLTAIILIVMTWKECIKPKNEATTPPRPAQTPMPSMLLTKTGGFNNISEVWVVIKWRENQEPFATVFDNERVAKSYYDHADRNEDGWNGCIDRAMIYSSFIQGESCNDEKD